MDLDTGFGYQKLIFFNSKSTWPARPRGFGNAPQAKIWVFVFVKLDFASFLKIFLLCFKLQK
jgi:hypothetical protein